MKPTSRQEAKVAGAIRYFTGKPCKNGHIGPRQTSKGQCILCRSKTLRTEKRQEAKEAGALRYFTGTPCRRGHLAERITKSGICVICMKENNQKHKTVSNAASLRIYHANKVAFLAKQKAYNQANPHIARAKEAQYRAAKLKATPAWADRAKINAIYRQAADQGMEVDHIIPLTNPMVCGLHVHNNLQLLTKPANSSKGNKFDPETFGP